MEFWYGNGFPRIVAIFGIDNTSSSHNDNQENNFLVLGEGPTKCINNSVGVAENNSVLILVKQRQNFVLSLHFNGNKSYLYINKKGICKFKANGNISWYKFC